MPLHDWTEHPREWENFHSLWIFRLFDAIYPQLPAGFQVYLGSYSRLGLAAVTKPDVDVTRPESAPAVEPAVAGIAPDDESAIAELEPNQTLFVRYRGMVAAAVELVSPGNKDRPAEREMTVIRYAAYLCAGINLIVADVHPNPVGFSFADNIAADVGLPNQPHLPAPAAVAYRVGHRVAAGGSMLAVWRRPLRVGQPLPVLPLPLSPTLEIAVDLEETYTLAAARAYLG